MSFADWVAEPVNWVFTPVALASLFCAWRVVTAHNVVHAALYLVAAVAGVAILFIMLSAEFVAWALILVYLGAVIVLFLFGIMITRAPTGLDEGLSSDRKLVPAALAAVLFGLLTWSSIEAFGTVVIDSTGVASSTELLGQSLLGRFLIPFEVVSIVLLAALIGGITLARRDLTPVEEEERVTV